MQVADITAQYNYSMEGKPHWTQKDKFDACHTVNVSCKNTIRFVLK